MGKLWAAVDAEGGCAWVGELDLNQGVACIMASLSLIVAVAKLHPKR